MVRIILYSQEERLDNSILIAGKLKETYNIDVSTDYCNNIYSKYKPKSSS
jgi:hypothetical protein